MGGIDGKRRRLLPYPVQLYNYPRVLMVMGQARWISASTAREEDTSTSIKHNKPQQEESSRGECDDVYEMSPWSINVFIGSRAAVRVTTETIPCTPEYLILHFFDRPHKPAVHFHTYSPDESTHTYTRAC